MTGLLLLASFVTLFDGKTLNGWKQCNGTAKFSVAAGEIVGTTNEGSPNSFLCSEREYGDFALEFETKTDPALNSGVQIRSHRYPAETAVRTFNGTEILARTQPAGRVYGYQVEVATEESGASGGIYDEARRGWLDKPADGAACKTAFKDNQWNKYRVEANGDRIRTWVNGVACADLVDSMDLTGFIALQVHAFKGEKPVQVRWRNIRIEDNGRHEWKPVFNGTSLGGWKHSGGGSFRVENGAIHATSVAGDERIGMIVSDASFGDVTARVKFRIANGNSGFFVRTDPETLAAYEVEIDSEKRTGGLWEVRGRNWVTGPEDNAGVMNDHWNDLTASLHGARIVFHLNGTKTVDLPNDTQGRKEGRLGLQAHGSKRPTDVWFKSVEVLAKAK
jgi:hypothetical protein